MAAGELKFKVGADLSGLDAARDALRGFEEKVEGLFRRRGGQRAELAIESAVKNIAAGNLPGAIESLASRMTGLGVIGGAATGLIAYGFSKLYDGAIKAVEATTQLQNVMRTGLIPAGSAEQAQAQIQGISQSIQAMAKETADPLEKLAAAVGRTKGIGGLVFGEFTKIRGDVLETMAAAMHQMVGDAASIAEFEERSYAARKETLTGNKDNAAAMEIENKLKIKMFDVDKQAGEQTQNILKALEQKAITPEQANPELARIRDSAVARNLAAQDAAEIDQNELARKTQIRAVDAAGEIALTQIKAAGLTPEQEKTALAQARIATLARELSLETEITAQYAKRRELIAAQTELATEQRKAREAAVKPTVEKALYSQDELLKMPRMGWIGGAFSVAQAQAREAARQQQLGEKARLEGRPQEAEFRFAQADIIRQQNRLLKPSEKPGADVAAALLEAINGANIFQQMNTALSTIATKVEAPDYMNH